MHAIPRAAVRQAVRHLVTAFAVLAWLNSAQAQFTSSRFSLREIGTGPNPTIELQYPFSVFDDVESLTSPSGEVFSASLTKSFATLDAAFGYLAGTWHGTFVPTFPFGSAALPFEFQIALVSPDAVYRGLPLNASLHDGDRIRSGETFLMNWNYESDVPLHQTSLEVLAQIDSFTFSSLTILGKPQPGGSTSVSGSSSVGTSNGSASFSRSYKSEPGASDYRFLTTYKASGSGSPLPADIALTMGAATTLDSAITNAPDGDTNPFNGPPRIGLRYFRIGDPIEFQLVPIPEPSAAVMLAIGTTFATVLRRRRQTVASRASDAPARAV
jgi:hypothetical protein